jgi:hypothetical protein
MRSLFTHNRTTSQLALAHAQPSSMTTTSLKNSPRAPTIKNISPRIHHAAHAGRAWGRRPRQRKKP